MTIVLTIVGGIAVATLLYAEARRPLGTRLPKMLASSAFVGTAVVAGALDSPFGRWMLVGLVASWLGDLLLTINGAPAFLAGLGAFLVAHLAYAGAFLLRGTGDWPAGAIVVSVAVSVVVGHRLLAHVPRDMKVPVMIYVVAITTMVAAALQAGAQDARLPLGAVGFYLSDLAVARQRFVRPGLSNRLWGLPLYFAAQFLFAWAAGG